MVHSDVAGCLLDRHAVEIVAQGVERLIRLVLGHTSWGRAVGRCGAVRRRLGREDTTGGLSGNHMGRWEKRREECWFDLRAVSGFK